MEKMTSVLLMLVILGVFIDSSQAIKCYVCSPCDQSSSLLVDCETGQNVCLTTISSANGTSRLLLLEWLHPKPCGSVGMRRGTDTQTTVANIHFASAVPHAKCKSSRPLMFASFDQPVKSFSSGHTEKPQNNQHTQKWV